jgi:biopolymer transport protein ExbD
MSAGGGGARPDINVTPLIDVLLVLLIIFMVVAPAKPSRFETKIPQKPQEQEQNLLPPEDLLMVVVQPNKQLELNTTPYTPQDLAQRLTTELENRVDKTVIIKAPTRIPYGDIIGVIDLVKGAGAEPIGLQVDFLEGQQQ